MSIKPWLAWFWLTRSNYWLWFCHCYNTFSRSQPFSHMNPQVCCVSLRLWIYSWKSGLSTNHFITSPTIDLRWLIAPWPFNPVNKRPICFDDFLLLGRDLCLEYITGQRGATHCHRWMPFVQFIASAIEYVCVFLLGSERYSFCLHLHIRIGLIWKTAVALILPLERWFHSSVSSDDEKCGEIKCVAHSFSWTSQPFIYSQSS